ncbi:hypothetical protein C1646_767887 [Rhizophagus diaphanus]|nr:hypothetical protein C1646_767887 [Rhizophagus diaphanus] [Rhizophagus sp. MUCL 43196]
MKFIDTPVANEYQLQAYYTSRLLDLTSKKLNEVLENAHVAHDNNLKKCIQYLVKLDDVTNQIFAIFEKQMDHVKVFIPVMEELVKSVKQLKEELAMFKNWGDVAEILSLEADNKVLYEETGKHYEQICTKLLVNVLKDFELTMSDFDQLLLMYDESISGFPNKKTTLADLPYAQVELAGTTFPESMADYKKLLEKALNAIGIWKKEFFN